MKLIKWLKLVFTRKCSLCEGLHQGDGFIIVDSQQYIHTEERI